MTRSVVRIRQRATNNKCWYFCFFPTNQHNWFWTTIEFSLYTGLCGFCSAAQLVPRPRPIGERASKVPARLGRDPVKLITPKNIYLRKLAPDGLKKSLNYRILRRILRLGVTWRCVPRVILSMCRRSAGST